MTAEMMFRQGVCLSCGQPCFYNLLAHCNACFDQAEAAEKKTGESRLDVLKRMGREYSFQRIDTLAGSASVERVEGAVHVHLERPAEPHAFRKPRTLTIWLSLNDHEAAALEAAVRRARGASPVTSTLEDALALEREAIAAELESRVLDGRVNLHELERIWVFLRWVRARGQKKAPPATTPATPDQEGRP